MSSSADSLWRLEWNEGLSMLIPEIDAEHQRFIRLVNELNEAIVGRMDTEEIKHRMQAIVDDAVTHFAHEEALLRGWGYPAAEEHAERHAQIIQALREIMARFEHDGTEYEWVEAGLQIKKALIEHLLNEDMKYRDYRFASGRQSGGSPG
jgi:hemerythrin